MPEFYGGISAVPWRFLYYIFQGSRAASLFVLDMLILVKCFCFVCVIPRICSCTAPLLRSHQAPLAGVPSEVVSWMSDGSMVLRWRAYCRRSCMWLIRTGLASLPSRPYILLIQKATETPPWWKHWATTESTPTEKVVKYGRWHCFRWFPTHYQQHFYDVDKQFIGPPWCQ